MTQFLHFLIGPKIPKDDKAKHAADEAITRYGRMALKDEYEQFDDYLEMVIEFGYVTLFASAFPLASILSIACNWVELKADLFKLTHVVRRPEAFQADSLGTWDTVLEGMVWMSVITNVSSPFLALTDTDRVACIFC